MNSFLHQASFATGYWYYDRHRSVRLVILVGLAIDQIAQSGLSSLSVIYYSAQLFSAINSLLNYSGFDSGTLASQSNFDAQLNNVLFPGTSAAGSGPGVSDALALYYLAGIDPVTSTVITLNSCA
ncbi:hypothetical protein [Serratia nevei]|uniref:hypothetical protein n=1 Tax=Serratia nevei TaxID=2703794 RepID=UPI002E19E696|nr:hypothetical protein [Serratia nevei]